MELGGFSKIAFQMEDAIMQCVAETLKMVLLKFAG
jgi:hypothetical protein